MMLVLVNALIALTLWLSLPFIVQALFRERAAAAQRGVIRCVLLGAPVLFLYRGQPHDRRSESQTSRPGA